jgi:hypothetical protein
MTSIKQLALCCLLFLTVGVADVHACMCLPGPTCEDTWKATAVFVGTVVAIDKRQPTNREDIYSNQVKIIVEESFRGDVGIQVVLLTGMSTCDVYFKVGQQYLVYAQKSSVENQLTTSICTRTRLLSEAGEDLSYLRNLSQASSGSTIQGKVQRLSRNSEGVGKFDPMIGIRVTVENSDKRMEFVSNAEGEFVAKGLSPGTYTVSIDVPKGLIGIKENSVTVSDKGCAMVQFFVQSDGRLSGQVTNILGHAVSGAEITIFPADKDPRSNGEPTKSNEQGIYELKRIAPGKYKLLIRYDGLSRFSKPFPPLYHPGVQSAAQATVIEIGDGEEIKNYNLVVPELPRDRTIEGIVVSSGGIPIKDAKVLLGFDAMFQPVSLDVGGRFSLKVYEGISIGLIAYIERDGKRTESTWVTVPRSGDPGKIKLVLEDKR